MNVKYELEGTVGRPEGNFQVARFWLELEINGRTAQSRGFTIEVPTAPLVEVRRQCREMAEAAQIRINAEAPAPKVADAALKNILSELYHV